MRANRIWMSALLGLFLVSCPAVASAEQATATAKEPDPLVVLRQMCDYLKSLQQFSFHSEVADDEVYLGGKKLQYGIDMETYVKRPDTVRVNAVGDLVNKQFFLNGRLSPCMTGIRMSTLPCKFPRTLKVRWRKPTKSSVCGWP